LYKILEETGAELILHGHEHLDLSATLPGKGGEVPVRGIQSGSYDSGEGAMHKRARYRIYEIADSCDDEDNSVGSRPAILSEELRLWNPAQKNFIEDDSNSQSNPVAVSA
ncbi:MAG: hypothetical protein JKY56_04680, partial [Kofleriaceae bacterium]|nr:hypothetical protein [Kofleriaceae bacterium]